MDRYLIKPGAKIDLSAIDPRDKSLFSDASKQDSHEQLHALCEELKYLQHLLFASQSAKVLVVIQAMDTGGKDGTVRHVFSSLDPQGLRVVSFKKPSEAELAHDFLWRVHKHTPGTGEVTVFNRSHYEDIIAARVKKLVPQEIWKKRYHHIVEFERLLADEGTLVIKIFLHISKAEQRKRLEKRLANPEKHWKFNPDDMVDRARWDEFQKAYEDVLSKTSTEFAPWYVIPADRKWYRNLAVARLMVDQLQSLKLQFPKISFDPDSIEFDD